MNSRLLSIGSVLMVVLLLAGALGIGYAAWTRPIAAADQALEAGQLEAALSAYAAAEARFDRLPAAKQLFAADYQRVVANQLWALYRLDRYDDTIAKAERAPEGAEPHFWSGCAFFEKGRAEEKPEARLGWFSRAEEELRRAVEASPGDWDTKFDFELTTRLVAELRKQPKAPPKVPMKLMRSQPKAADKPVKPVG